MCIKTIYHNTYVGGATDITERVDSCVPGYLCANPRVREVDRALNYAKLSLTGRQSPSYTDVRPSSPLTPPGSRGSDTERRRRTGVYVDGNKYVEVRHERSPRRHRDRPTLAEPKHFIPRVPEPPAPRPIPIKRASTMPYGMETPPERGRRPIIVEERVTTPRHHSDAVPLGPVEVLEHASSGRRRSSRIDADLLHPHRRRHSRSPQGYGSAEDEHERRERHRRRRERRAQAVAMATSVPTFTNTDVYSSSYGSSYASSPASSPIVGQSPAVAAVKKELRWEDQLRAAQNARIRQRPKLSRSATVNAGVSGEVKSILKKASRSPVAEPRRKASADDELAELYRSVEGMNLHEEKRESSTERRTRLAEETDSQAYIDRLKNRFSMPPRRYTAGTGPRRRTEIWYPDEGWYKYQ